MHCVEKLGIEIEMNQPFLATGEDARRPRQAGMGLFTIGHSFSDRRRFFLVFMAAPAVL